MWVICSWFKQIACKKRVIRSKILFSYVLTVFHLFMLKSKSLLLLFAHWLFFKERQWAIRSGCSWQKSKGSDLLFFMSESFFCSQKRGNRSKIRWANSQTCPFLRPQTKANIFYTKALLCIKYYLFFVIFFCFPFSSSLKSVGQPKVARYST